MKRDLTKNIMQFLREYNIDYIEHGPHVSEGNVYINCPFCNGDTEHFMGIRLKDGWYGCYWNPKQHGGKKIQKLVAKLIGCSLERAKEIIGLTPVLEGEFDFLTSVDRMMNGEGEKQEEDDFMIADVEPYKEFMELKSNGSGDRFWRYLKRRGFDQPSRLLEMFDIWYAVEGEYKDRLIFPYFFHTKLVSWSSRIIYDNVDIRYKDLPPKKSVIGVKQLLYNYDELMLIKGKALFVVEGIFDVFKLDYHLPEGYRATCLATKSVRDNQIRLLKNLSDRYQMIYLMLDEEEISSILQIYSDLSFLPNIKPLFLPNGLKDPGAMDKQDVYLLMSMVRGQKEIS